MDQFWDSDRQPASQLPKPAGGGVRARSDSEELTLAVGFPRLSRFRDVRGIGAGPEAQPVAQFDPALMQAIARQWPDIVFSRPQVVASGMTPPDTVPN